MMQAVTLCAETGVFRNVVQSKPPNRASLPVAKGIIVVRPDSPLPHIAKTDLRQQKLRRFCCGKLKCRFLSICN